MNVRANSYEDALQMQSKLRHDGFQATMYVVPNEHKLMRYWLNTDAPVNIIFELAHRD